MTNKKILILLVLLSLLLLATLKAQTPVTAVTIDTSTATPFSYDVGSTTYLWGQGDDLFLSGLEALGNSYTIDNALQRDIIFIRVNNILVAGERCRVFAERNSNNNYDPTYPTDDLGNCSMEASLVEPIVNRGALDIFHNVNSSSQHANNIERIDIVFYALVAPAALSEIGFLATEKAGNNDYKAAAITSLDSLGNPASFGKLVLIDGSNGSSNSYGEFGAYDYRFIENAESGVRVEPIGYHNTNETVGYSLITFDSLGISEGDHIYGISFFGKDVVAGTGPGEYDLLKPEDFPQNTNEGADVYGGLGSYFTTTNVSVADLIDTDLDGVADATDLDDDNDGIPDLVEIGANPGSPLDSDRDSIPDYLDLDADNDGIPDIIEAGGIDTDGDGRVDYPTAGDPTSIDDLDEDGLADTYDDTDTAGSTPGWTGGTSIANPDTDGDGLEDAIDLDADNDGIPDLVEAGGIDTNGDGWVDGLNGDGTLTNDADRDGFSDHFDPDDDPVPGIDSGEGAQPLVETSGVGALLNGESGTALDTDGDNLPDHLDLDADNDGIPDLVEAGGIDIDGNGRVDVTTDADTDGYADIYDADDDSLAGVEDATDPLQMTGGTDTDGDGKADEGTVTFLNGNGENADTDRDSIPDHLDLDADNDGIPDLVESGAADPENDGQVDTGALPWDADGDGLADVYDQDASDGPAGSGVDGTALVKTDADTNSDGLVNSTEGMIAGGTNVIHADNDAYPNHLDLDADNDGVTDVVENAAGDINADHGGSGNLDGIVNGFTDSGNDGWNDSSNSNTTDTDGDQIPDYLDIDADNDGIADYIESVCSACPTAAGPGGSTADGDGNGVLDIYENMSADNTDNTTGSHTGANPNKDDDDLTDNVPDYIDLDTDEDGAYDWAEGFDVDGDGYAFDDLINMAAAFGTPAAYPATDTDNDGIPNWLDNQPGTTGYTENAVPPFLDPLNAAWLDANKNGLADIFDPAEGGNMAPTPDNDSMNDSDWRDVAAFVFLPVELTRFEGLAEGCLVNVSWTTASEEAFNFYQLERSTDGVKFKTIQKINAAGGNFSQSYQYRDEEANGLNYYRLKMVDLDGSFTYSDVLIVATNCVTKNENAIILFPNPIGLGAEQLNLRFYAHQTEIRLMVTAQGGELVKVLSLPVELGWNTMRLDITDLAPGAYFIVHDQLSGKRVSKPFIVVRE